MLLQFLLLIQIVCFVGGAEKLNCLEQCPTDKYQPVCSHGISYANLCVLKMEVCKKRLGPEVLEKVEPCAKFDKVADAKDISPELIDKNGAIFRSWFP